LAQRVIDNGYINIDSYDRWNSLRKFLRSSLCPEIQCILQLSLLLRGGKKGLNLQPMKLACSQP